MTVQLGFLSRMTSKSCGYLDGGQANQKIELNPIQASYLSQRLQSFKPWALVHLIGEDLERRRDSPGTLTLASVSGVQESLLYSQLNILQRNCCRYHRESTHSTGMDQVQGRTPLLSWRSVAKYGAAERPEQWDPNDTAHNHRLDDCRL